MKNTNKIRLNSLLYRTACFLLMTGILPAPAEEAESPLDQDALLRRVEALEQSNSALREELTELQQQSGSANPLKFLTSAGGESRVLFSGEAGIAYFDTGSEGNWPNREFRIDEARLFLDVMLMDNIFFFTEVNLAERESDDIEARMGEVYVDIEGLAERLDAPVSIALRAGRFDIPLGEEYLTRDAIDNPLVSHSLADLWGVDEGVAVYGKIGSAFDYIAAVQNGGFEFHRDGDAEKSLTGRIGANPLPGLRVSVSAYHSGDIDMTEDLLGEMWFGNAYLAGLGSRESTSRFHYEIYQADLRYTWEQGHLALAAGQLDYDDNDTEADQSRDASFQSLELVNRLYGRLYGAVRLSRIDADDGLFLVGQGRLDSLLESRMLTEELTRISLGLGYRLHEQVLIKSEYSFEDGEDTEDNDLENRDLFSAQIAVGF